MSGRAVEISFRKCESGRTTSDTPEGFQKCLRRRRYLFRFTRAREKQKIRRRSILSPSVDLCFVLSFVETKLFGRDPDELTKEHQQVEKMWNISDADVVSAEHKVAKSH